MIYPIIYRLLPRFKDLISSKWESIWGAMEYLSLFQWWIQEKKGLLWPILFAAGYVCGKGSPMVSGRNKANANVMTLNPNMTQYCKGPSSLPCVNDSLLYMNLSLVYFSIRVLYKVQI